MQLTETISLLAAVLVTIAPALQVLHIIRTGSKEGLSVLTSIALVVSNCLALLLGIQYQLGSTIIIMALTLLLQAIMLHLVSSRVSLAVWGGVLALILGAELLAPQFAADILTTRYNEQVAFIWGVIAAPTFIPQVLAVRKTRQTESLSLMTIICFAVGFTLWVAFAWLVKNWSLLLWFGIMTISVYELLRIKLVTKPVPAAALSE